MDGWTPSAVIGVSVCMLLLCMYVIKTIFDLTKNVFYGSKISIFPPLWYHWYIFFLLYSLPIVYSCGMLPNTEAWIGREVDVFTRWKMHLFAHMCPQTHPLSLLHPGKDQLPDGADDKRQCHLVREEENRLGQWSLFNPSIVIQLVFQPLTTV